jgi:cytochrome c551/c552
MKISSVKRCFKVSVSTLIISMIGLSSFSAHAKDLRDDKQVKLEDIALRTAIQKGDQLWHDPTLGSNGLACANCHGDASATNPHSFPKYQTNLGKVSTLREMINWCIAVPLQGLPLDLDSDEMIAMESYATAMHSGVAINLGVDEQHGGTPVASGPGYKAVTEEEKKFLTAASGGEVSTKTIGDLELAGASGCLGCHSVEKKVVGPAWRDVSNKYKDDPEARAFLINKVAKGGGGNWTSITGGFKMPPNHPRVSMENITLMVDFVLSISKDGK